MARAAIPERPPNPLALTPKTSGRDSEPKAPPLSDRDDEARTYVQNRLRDCSSANAVLQRRWVTNKALRIGRQYAIWSESTGRYTKEPVPSWRERHVTNVINPVIKTYIAQLLKNNPEWDTVPSSPDIEAVSNAKFAKKVLDYHLMEWKWALRSQHLASWMLETGSAFGKVIFDPSRGPLSEAVDENGQPLAWPGSKEASGAEVLMVDDGGRPLTWQPGGIICEVISPFQIMVDPSFVGDLDDAPYILQVSVQPLEWFQDHFERGKYVVGDSGIDDSLMLERQFQYLAGGTSTFGDETEVDYAVYAECWVRPTKRYPRGRWLCLGGDVVLQDSDSPYLYVRGARPDRDWHPYVHFSCVPIGGRFWPLDIIGDCVGIQRAINNLTSWALEVMKLMGKPKWMVPDGALPKGYRISSEPGENVPFRPAYGAPYQAAGKDLPASFFKLLEMMFSNLDFVSSQHGPSRGQAPQGIKSGIGLALLQEQDELDLGPISRLWEMSLAELGRKCLLRVAQYWDTKRKVAIMGPNEEFDAFMFSGADVSSTMDVVVRAGSSLPKSRAATMAYVKDMVNMGVYQPALNPDHRRRVMEMLEIGSREERLDEGRQQRRRAQIENLLMLRGILPTVEYYHDHDAHAEEHLHFLNTDEYRRKSAENPQLEVLVNVHLAMHFGPQNQAAQMERQQIGAPIGPGQLMGGQQQGSVPQEGNPKANLGGMQGLVGLPQAAANANQAK